MSGRIIKGINALKAGSSFLAGYITGRPAISGMPVSVSFELTNLCNLKCPECASGNDMMKRMRGFMDIDLFKKVLSEIDPYLLYINLYFQGEPMLHPEFFSFARLTGGAYSVVSTNGHFLSEENSEKIVKSGLKKLIVSLDGTSQEVYSKYRTNGDLEQVIAGIRNVASARDRLKSSLKLELQFLVNRYNEQQISDARILAREAGASLKLKSMQVITGDKAEEWMPLSRKFRRYKKNINGKFEVNSSLPDRCARLWFNPVITWDGFVVPCCFDKDAEFIMGDLKKESFRAIWNNIKYIDFRSRVFSDRKSIGICNNCTSGLKGAIY